MTTDNLKQHDDKHTRPTTPETIPGTASSSSSLDEIAAALFIGTSNNGGHTNGNGSRHSNNHSISEEDNDSPAGTPSKANAPSAVCQQRKLSAAIVTTPDRNSAPQDYVSGRPTMTVEQLQSFESPPKPKHVSKHHHRGVSTSDSHRRKHRDELMMGGGRNSNGNHSEENLRSSINHKSLSRQFSTPAKPEYTQFLNDLHPMRVDAWAEAPTLSYTVRGQSYMKDHKKVQSEDAVFSLLTVDAVRTADNKPILGGLCYHPGERIQRALRREEETGVAELPEFVFAINLAIPGPPFYHVVIYFGCDDIEALKTNETPLGRLARPFFFGSSDDFRDSTFKLIPRIVEGNFIVKKAVGSQPTILGRKVKQHYIRHPRFLELIVDIGQDPIARNVVGLCLGYAQTLVVDMMLVLEGLSEETLPERILGGVRLKNLDFKKRDGKRKVSNYP